MALRFATSTDTCGKIPNSVLLEIQDECNKSGCTALDPFAGSGFATLSLGENVRCTDVKPWAGHHHVGTQDALAAIDASRENEQILIMMFPPPQSDVPVKVLKRASEKGFRLVYIMQEELEAYHCGNQSYVDLVEQLGAIELDDYETPNHRNGFYTKVWKICL
jgi:hypothetical protein